ncbi:hypothetical protein QBC35DRAFT_467775 [Podospora australis]|uniref:Rhodopsin domain-containing protein n=1 Tax=Podospora australis TaxID=1536484 RepID=A0AAN6WJL6_9PEZI|nr:hypothetical protein QBC35DRAFT_467775 [Podospora australis]
MVRSDKTRQDELVITASVFTSISVMLVTLRMFVRGWIMNKLGSDDWTLLVALFFACGYFVEIILAKFEGLGFAMGTLTFDNMQNQIKITLSIQCTYYACVTFVKFSILCMYLRLFAAADNLRRTAIGLIVFHALFFVVCLSVTLAQCQPIGKMWDLLGELKGTCINTTAFFYFTSSFNILTDIIILGLPIKTLLGINRPQKEKIALVSIFGIGTFATITSIIRLHTIYTYTLAVDPFQEGILVNLWSVLEVNVAIICATAPALKPLFHPEALRKIKQASSGSGSSYVPPNRSEYEFHSRGRSGLGSRTGIKSKMSVQQSFTTVTHEENIQMGRVIPFGSTTTKITGGDDSDALSAVSTKRVLED